MDDLSFWGAEGDAGAPMSMADEWAGAEDIAAEVMSGEHLIKHVPAHVALFVRTFPTYTETMLIQGFPAAKLITVSHPAVADIPGCVRELPVGWRDMATAETFRARFEQVVGVHADFGWRRVRHGAEQVGG